MKTKNSAQSEKENAVHPTFEVIDRNNNWGVTKPQTPKTRNSKDILTRLNS